jgi:hypothetical protein
MEAHSGSLQINLDARRRVSASPRSITEARMLSTKSVTMSVPGAVVRPHPSADVRRPCVQGVHVEGAEGGSGHRDHAEARRDEGCLHSRAAGAAGGPGGEQLRV